MNLGTFSNGHTLHKPRVLLCPRHLALEALIVRGHRGHRHTTQGTINIVLNDIDIKWRNETAEAGPDTLGSIHQDHRNNGSVKFGLNRLTVVQNVF